MLINAGISINQRKLWEKPFGSERKEDKKNRVQKEGDGKGKSQDIKEERDQKRLGSERKQEKSVEVDKESGKRKKRGEKIGLMPQISKRLPGREIGEPRSTDHSTSAQQLLLPFHPSHVLLLCSFPCGHHLALIPERRGHTVTLTKSFVLGFALSGHI